LKSYVFVGEKRKEMVLHQATGGKMGGKVLKRNDKLSVFFFFCKAFAGIFCLFEQFKRRET